MESSEIIKISNQMAIAIKKAGNKSALINLDIKKARIVANACAVLGRIMKLAEADAEVLSIESRLKGSDSGRTEVWRLIIQELDFLDIKEKEKKDE